METNIDAMKYRKSTHLAGVDVEAIIAEKGKCELTIKLAFYDKGVDVSGNKTDGHFLSFEEPVKDMVVNSGNRKKISEMVRINKGLTAVESRNIGNWTGFKLNLLFDENIKMMGQKVGGIVVDRNYTQPIKLTFEQAKAEFEAVSSRETFVTAMTRFKDFMSNPEIVAICTSLAAIYPNPAAK